MALLNLFADAGRRLSGLFRGPEFACGDCEYANSCAAATDDCILRPEQARKWKKNRVPTLLVDADAIIQRFHGRW